MCALKTELTIIPRKQERNILELLLLCAMDNSECDIHTMVEIRDVNLVGVCIPVVSL